MLIGAEPASPTWGGQIEKKKKKKKKKFSQFCLILRNF
jgi:hypothetical protein